MQRPTVLAFVLCEQIITEEGTRNVTLVNCFNHRVVEQEPPEPLSFVAFAQLSDGQGGMPLGVVIHRLDTFDEVFDRIFQVRFPEQRQESRFSMRISDCALPVIGAYQVALVAGGEPIAQRRLRIKLKRADHE